ncbi:MAG: hypothetical protein JNJ45_04925 [Chthonomonas sp.]|nr:hypothetical protein [Chthonomonas sp.]
MISGVLLSGCGGGGALTTLPNPKYRYFNLSVDATINASLNDSDVATNVPYLGGTPAFNSVEFRNDADGGYDATTYVPSTEIEVRNEQVWQRDQEYIWISYGLANFGTENIKRLEQTFFTVDRDAPVGNRARLIIFNALVEKDGVDPYAIDFRSFDPSNPAGGENPQFNRANLSFGDFSTSTHVLDIDSGTLTFQARQNGADAAVVYAQKTFVFDPGGVYLAVVSGKVGSPTVALQPQITFFKL